MYVNEPLLPLLHKYIAVVEENITDVVHFVHKLVPERIQVEQVDLLAVEAKKIVVIDLHDLCYAIDIFSAGQDPKVFIR